MSIGRKRNEGKEQHRPVGNHMTLAIFQRHTIFYRQNFHQHSTDMTKLQSTSDNAARLRLPGQRMPEDSAEYSPAAHGLDAMETAQ